MFKSTHNLQFEVAPYELNIDTKKIWKRFKVGTVTGLWTATDDAYEILALENDNPNNGHFTDVLEWFEQSCKRDKKKFIIREFMNNKFKNHLRRKKGFKPLGKKDLIKKF